MSRPVSLISHGGARTQRCTVRLMRWSPFPCSFNASQLIGIPGVPSNLCTNELSNGQFLGAMPSLDRACFPSNDKNGRQILSVKLSLRFKVAQGRQFDRTYSMYIKNSVVSDDVYR